jgi:DNA processing protein
MTREHRNMLLEGQLTLISPYDPNAGFNVGHAMQRNKLVYALADASLVVSSDVEKGGTWTGAVEQLDKFKFGPLFVRSTGEESKGLDRLRIKGARAWPNPDDADALNAILATPIDEPGQCGLPFSMESNSEQILQTERPSCESKALAPSKNTAAGPTRSATIQEVDPPLGEVAEFAANPSKVSCQSGDTNPAETLFAVVQNSIERLLSRPMKHVEVAQALQIDPKQAKDWLDRLANVGVLEKGTKPVVYMLKRKQLL